MKLMKGKNAINKIHIQHKIAAKKKEKLGIKKIQEKAGEKKMEWE